MAAGVRNLNCAVPEKTSELAAQAAAGCILRGPPMKYERPVEAVAHLPQGGFQIEAELQH
eukprot:10294870-Alexandrium_andersonii.AAC.1